MHIQSCKQQPANWNARVLRQHFEVKAMDKPGHVTKFLHYRHFSLCNSISIKNEIGNWKFVELNKIHCLVINVYISYKINIFKEIFFIIINNYDQTDLVYFIYSHKFLTCYLIFYRNGVIQIENAGKVGI